MIMLHSILVLAQRILIVIFGNGCGLTSYGMFRVSQYWPLHITVQPAAFWLLVEFQSHGHQPLL